MKCESNSKKILRKLKTQHANTVTGFDMFAFVLQGEQHGAEF
jgi:hypothetical protein